MVKTKKSNKTAYILGFIGVVILMMATAFIIYTNKRPYRNYEDNVHMYYNIVYREGKYYYVIRENPVAFYGDENADKEAGIWIREQQFYFEKFNENTLEMEYELAFVANIYDYNGYVFLRLNEIDKKIPNLVIDE